MSRTVHELRLMELIRSELQGTPISDEKISELFPQLTPDDWNQLLQLSEANRMHGIVMDSLMLNRKIPVPMPIGRFLQQTEMRSSFAYYRKIFVLTSMLELLRSKQADGYLLKGASLNILYPREESRSFGDIDLFIPDKAAHDRVCRAMEARGYPKEQEDMTDYHSSYVFQQDDVSCPVEIHYFLNCSWQNGDFDQKLARIYSQALAEEAPEKLTIMEVEVQGLPVTMEALYLLMHMFQHFMNKGFGLRLFTDWLVFWQKKGSRVNRERFSEWIHALGLECFVDVINSICVRYLGMELPDFGWLAGEPDAEIAEQLLDDVFAGGEFGKQDSNRMIVTTRKAGLKGYLYELHRQTKKRFPKSSKYVILLPVLWCLTGLIFEYNNFFRRKIALKDVLASTNTRNQLAQKMHIFEEK